MGLGNGCLFCPSMAVLSTYFHKRRAIAIGVAASGTATGGLVFPSMVRELLPRIGFAWTVRCLGLVSVVTMAVANLGIRPRIPPRRSGRFVEWGAFKEREYTFYAVGSFFVSFLSCDVEPLPRLAPELPLTGVMLNPRETHYCTSFV